MKVEAADHTELSCPPRIRALIPRRFDVQFFQCRDTEGTPLEGSSADCFLIAISRETKHVSLHIRQSDLLLSDTLLKTRMLAPAYEMLDRALAA